MTRQIEHQENGRDKNQHFCHFDLRVIVAPSGVKCVRMGGGRGHHPDVGVPVRRGAWRRVSIGPYSICFPVARMSRTHVSSVPMNFTNGVYNPYVKCHYGDAGYQQS